MAVWCERINQTVGPCQSNERDWGPMWMVSGLVLGMIWITIH